MNKEITKLIRTAQRRGWTLEYGRTHDKLVHPSGAKVIVSKSPSDGMAPRQVQRDIARVEREVANAERA